MRLFDRTCKVTVWLQKTTGGVGAFAATTYFQKVGDGIEIIGGENPLGLRIKFNVEKNLASQPNKCTIVIFNLAEQTRTSLEKSGLAVRLDAGYDGVARLLFTGDLRYAVSDYKPPNWETTLHVADGARAHSFAQVNKSFKAPVTVKDVLKYAADTMELTIPPDLDDSPELAQALNSGLTLHGNTRDALTELLAPYGYNWSIQNGRLQILSDLDVRLDQAVVVDGTEENGTGLIGSPQRVVPDKPGSVAEWNWEMMLYPELNPGSQAQLTSKTINGNGKMIQIVHTGDTRAGDWKSAVKAIPIGGRMPKPKKVRRQT